MILYIFFIIFYNDLARDSKCGVESTLMISVLYKMYADDIVILAETQNNSDIVEIFKVLNLDLPEKKQIDLNIR